MGPHVPSTALCRRLGWSVFWVYNLFVYQSAILPPEKIPIILIKIDDKLFHAIEYFILCILAVTAFLGAKAYRFYSHPLRLAFAWCLFMGIVTEVSQAFVKGRSASFLDWVADLGGVFLALVFYLLWKKIRQKSDGVNFS